MGNNGRFSDGFLMGAIAGGALVFLLGTEKGNKVLKLIIEEGKVGMSELMEEIDNFKNEAIQLQEEAEAEEEAASNEVLETTPKPNGANHSVEKSKSSKRFFKKK